MITGIDPMYPLTCGYHFSRAIRTRHKISLAHLLVSATKDYQIAKIQ
jgi:hypothetical protein